MLNERERALEYARNILRAQYDDATVERWFHTPNRNLENHTPADLITLGQWREVVELITREGKDRRA